jgi:hypothetical protein
VINTWAVDAAHTSSSLSLFTGKINLTSPSQIYEHFVFHIISHMRVQNSERPQWLESSSWSRKYDKLERIKQHRLGDRCNEIRWSHEMVMSAIRSSE